MQDNTSNRGSSGKNSTVGVELAGVFNAHPGGVASLAVIGNAPETHPSTVTAKPLLEDGECPSAMVSGEGRGLMMTCGKVEGMVKIWDYTYVGEGGACGRYVFLRTRRASSQKTTYGSSSYFERVLLSIHVPQGLLKYYDKISQVTTDPMVNAYLPAQRPLVSTCWTIDYRPGGMIDSSIHVKNVERYFIVNLTRGAVHRTGKHRANYLSAESAKSTSK